MDYTYHWQTQYLKNGGIFNKQTGDNMLICYLDHIIQFIPPVTNNYDRFVGAVNLVAKKHILRGFRIRYIPGLNRECEELYKEFQGKENYKLQINY